MHLEDLTRAFRRRLGRSIGSCVLAVRLKWTADRLAGSHDLLADIAAVGWFADQSISRLFRQQFGCTPAGYRQRLSGD